MKPEGIEPDDILHERKRWQRASAASILALVGSSVLMFAVYNPFVSKCGPVNPLNACIANLKQIDGAKSTWALENKKAKGARPTTADLFGPTLYIREKPVCPSGGAYALGTVGRKPRCSIPGHSI